MSDIGKLIALVPPSRSSMEDAVDWTGIESRLGLRLPDDYKEIIKHYGSGTFCDELSVCPPERLLDNRGLAYGWDWYRRRFPGEIEYPLYPEPGGLLWWGNDASYGVFCWLTEGDCQDWKVVFWHQRDGWFAQSEGGAADFLAGELQFIVDEAARCGDAWFPGPWFTPFAADRELITVYIGLSGGEGTFDDRLRLLTEFLAPVRSRGGHIDPQGRSCQAHFDAAASRWRVTYDETPYGHQIQISYPPEDERSVRADILAAVEAMGCRVRAAYVPDSGQAAWGFRAL